ncbi:MAG: hypothetical protein C5S48_05550 [Candidatus Methanogaster sp.]|nr:MAG: hypothetical protein C5S48_05550 [ANME-2 cluster archaeon]
MVGVCWLCIAILDPDWRNHRAKDFYSSNLCIYRRILEVIVMIRHLPLTETRNRFGTIISAGVLLMLAGADTAAG